MLLQLLQVLLLQLAHFSLHERHDFLLLALLLKQVFLTADLLLQLLVLLFEVQLVCLFPLINALLLDLFGLLVVPEVVGLELMLFLDLLDSLVLHLFQLLALLVDFFVLLRSNFVGLLHHFIILTLEQLTSHAQLSLLFELMSLHF